MEKRRNKSRKKRGRTEEGKKCDRNVRIDES
jgi:hypothetical protein